MGLVGINIVLGLALVGAFSSVSLLCRSPAPKEPEMDPNEVWFLAERIKRGEMGDDIPILMADAGCDYEMACDAVFGGLKEVALHMLESAVKERQAAAPKQGEQTL